MRLAQNSLDVAAQVEAAIRRPPTRRAAGQFGPLEWRRLLLTRRDATRRVNRPHSSVARARADRPAIRGRHSKPATRAPKHRSIDSQSGRGQLSPASASLQRLTNRPLRVASFHVASSELATWRALTFGPRVVFTFGREPEARKSEPDQSGRSTFTCLSVCLCVCLCVFWAT